MSEHIVEIDGDEIVITLRIRTAASSAPPPAAELVSIEEAARRCGVSRRTMGHWTERGTIASMRVGRRRLIPVAAIEALISTNEQPI